MSSNAIGAFAVICVTGFAGCAATARATPVEAVAPAPYVRAIERPVVASRNEVVASRSSVRVYTARAAARNRRPRD